MTDADRSDTAPAEPSLKEQVLDQMGGWQGMVYSALPVVAFLPANKVWGLTGGAIAAVVVAALVAVVRLATRTSLQPAISGFIGVAICVAIALFVGGNGKGYFLYGIVMQAVLALVFLVSLAVRWPLVGVVWHFFVERDEQDAPDEAAQPEAAQPEAAPDEAAADEPSLRSDAHEWRADKPQFRAFAWLTVLWTLMFAVRFVVQGVLYLDDNVGGLGVARLLMGWPMFALGLLITFFVARRFSHAHGR